MTKLIGIIDEDTGEIIFQGTLFQCERRLADLIDEGVNAWLLYEESEK